MSLDLAVKPRVSEKSFAGSEQGVYVFDVPRSANKHTVKSAIESQYGVTVAAVRTVIVKGKPKRVVRKRQRPVEAHRSDVKKAYVTLKKGDKIASIAEGAA